VSEPDHTNTASGASPSTDVLEVQRLRARVRHLQEVLHRKNVALDALHWVWCDGGCVGGIHRWSDIGLSANTELTEELVQAAEHNAARMRRWLNNSAFRSRWASMTADERLKWMAENTKTSTA
jgi:hypothetical protein